MNVRKTLSLFIAAATVATALGPVAHAGGLSTRFQTPLAPADGCDCDARGKASYRDDAGERRFYAEARGFPVGTVLEVQVGGEPVGSMTVIREASGQAVGKLNYRDKVEDGIEDDPRGMFPANFPAVLAGSSVMVGPLSGTFGLTEISGGGGTGGGGTVPGEVAAGDLRCGANAAGEDASIDAEFRNENGRMRFDAKMEAAPGGSWAAGERVSVRVDGVEVGVATLATVTTGDVGVEFKLDSQVEAGDDSQPFPVGFPGVAIGSAVSLAPVSGSAPTLSCALQAD